MNPYLIGAVPPPRRERREIRLGMIEPVKKDGREKAIKRAREGALADVLAQGDIMAPLQSGSALEGLARGGQAFIETRAARDKAEEGERRRHGRADTLAEALDALQGDQLPPGVEGPVRPGSPRRAASILAQNPDTAEMAFTLSMADAQRKRENEQWRERFGVEQEGRENIAKIRAGSANAREGRIGQYNPSDYTSESWARFVQTRDPSVLKRFEGFTRYGGGIYNKATAEREGDVTEDLKSGKAAEAEGTEIGKFAGKFPQMQSKAQSALEATEQKFENLSGTIDKAIKQSDSGWGTGLFGSIASLVPGTPQHDLAGTLETIRAISGFATLQEMRQNSPTGGALGQVSNTEIGLLQNAIVNVRQSQTKEQLQENLRLLKQQMQSSLQRVRDAYERDYGSVSRETIPNGEGGGDGPGTGVDDLIEKYRSR